MMLKKAGYRIGFAGKYGMKFQKPGLKNKFDYFKPIGRNPYIKKMKNGLPKKAVRQQARNSLPRRKWKIFSQTLAIRRF